MECNNILFRLAGSREPGMSHCTKAQMRLGLSAFLAVLLLFSNDSLRRAGHLCEADCECQSNRGTCGDFVEPSWVDEFNSPGDFAVRRENRCG